MLKVDNVQTPSFKGAWGEVRNVKGKPVINYYSFLDDTKEQVQKDVWVKMKSLNETNNHTPWWSALGEKVKAKVVPINLTKTEFERSNRGFFTDELAKMLIIKK